MHNLKTVVDSLGVGNRRRILVKGNQPALRAQLLQDAPAVTTAPEGAIHKCRRASPTGHQPLRPTIPCGESGFGAHSDNAPSSASASAGMASAASVSRSKAAAFHSSEFMAHAHQRNLAQSGFWRKRAGSNTRPAESSSRVSACPAAGGRRRERQVCHGQGREFFHHRKPVLFRVNKQNFGESRVTTRRPENSASRHSRCQAGIARRPLLSSKAMLTPPNMEGPVSYFFFFQWLRPCALASKGFAGWRMYSAARFGSPLLPHGSGMGVAGQRPAIFILSNPRLPSRVFP